MRERSFRIADVISCCAVLVAVGCGGQDDATRPVDRADLVLGEVAQSPIALTTSIQGSDGRTHLVRADDVVLTSAGRLRYRMLIDGAAREFWVDQGDKWEREGVVFGFEMVGAESGPATFIVRPGAWELAEDGHSLLASDAPLVTVSMPTVAGHLADPASRLLLEFFSTAACSDVMAVGDSLKQPSQEIGTGTYAEDFMPPEGDGPDYKPWYCDCGSGRYSAGYPNCGSGCTWP